jgi:hypothetical protein
MKRKTTNLGQKKKPLNNSRKMKSTAELRKILKIRSERNQLKKREDLADKEGKKGDMTATLVRTKKRKG